MKPFEYSTDKKTAGRAMKKTAGRAVNKTAGRAVNKTAGYHSSQWIGAASMHVVKIVDYPFFGGGGVESEDRPYMSD